MFVFYGGDLCYYPEAFSYINEAKCGHLARDESHGEKRHRIPKSDGSDEHIKAEDLTVGMELTIYGKTIKVRSAPASSGLRRLSRLI